MNDQTCIVILVKITIHVVIGFCCKGNVIILKNALAFDKKGTQRALRILQIESNRLKISGKEPF